MSLGEDEGRAGAGRVLRPRGLRGWAWDGAWFVSWGAEGKDVHVWMEWLGEEG